jgi:hypothetical protein
MNNEKESLVRCREMIEQALNWGPSSNWSNLDFDNLSEKILEKTGERLSVSTLKRIWGKVRYDSTPTLATLNVLARFLDYENWRKMVSVHGPQSTVHSNAAADVNDNRLENSYTDQPHSSQKPWTVDRGLWTGNWRMQIYFGLAAAVLFGMFVFLFVRGKTPSVDESGVVFESRVVSDDLPNSVVFTYDIGNLPADSVFIQQSWDPQRRERVSPAGNRHTSIYYKPGYFQAKLIVNNAIKKERDVFIKTKGWRGIIDGASPVYLGEDEMRQPGGMGIDGATLRDKTGSPVFTERWTIFTNVREFEGLDHQNFTLDVGLRNTAMVEECLCRRVQITLLQKGNAIIIPLAAKGCISGIDLLTPSRYRPGKEYDLSAFGYESEDFQHVRCQVAADTFRILINKNVAFQEKITRPLNELVGIRIGFEGTGEIEYMKLSSPGKIILQDQFNAAISKH